jgi:hypothetical protein
LEWRRNIKEDGCGRKLYKGGNLDVWDGIFHFKEGNEGKPLWMVLLRELQKDMMYSLRILKSKSSKRHVAEIAT